MRANVKMNTQQRINEFEAALANLLLDPYVKVLLDEYPDLLRWAASSLTLKEQLQWHSSHMAPSPKPPHSSG